MNSIDLYQRDDFYIPEREETVPENEQSYKREVWKKIADRVFRIEREEYEKVRWVLNNSRVDIIEQQHGFLHSLFMLPSATIAFDAEKCKIRVSVKIYKLFGVAIYRKKQRFCFFRKPQKHYEVQNNRAIAAGASGNIFVCQAGRSKEKIVKVFRKGMFQRKQVHRVKQIYRRCEEQAVAGRRPRGIAKAYHKCAQVDNQWIAISHRYEGDLMQIKPMNEKEAVELCYEVLSGVVNLHSAGYMHCDLKRENIFVERKNGTFHGAIGDYDSIPGGWIWQLWDAKFSIGYEDEVVNLIFKSIFSSAQARKLGQSLDVRQIADTLEASITDVHFTNRDLKDNLKALLDEARLQPQESRMSSEELLRRFEILASGAVA